MTVSFVKEGDWCRHHIQNVACSLGSPMAVLVVSLVHVFGGVPAKEAQVTGEAIVRLHQGQYCP